MTDLPLANVLDVGQCNPDHHAIKSIIMQHFQARVDRAQLTDQAMDALQQKQYHLVLVNRIIDRDGSEGIILIQRIKQDQKLLHIPVMMVSNYPQAQDQAVNAGAVPGFGKAELSKPQTLERLKQFLPGRKS
ncbi:MAG: response regulator [Planctomycetota bacterium]